MAFYKPALHLPKSLSISSSVIMLEFGLIGWFVRVLISLLVLLFHADFLLYDIIASATWVVRLRLFFKPTDPLLLLFFINDILWLILIITLIIIYFVNDFSSWINFKDYYLFLFSSNLILKISCQVNTFFKSLKLLPFFNQYSNFNIKWFYSITPNK